MSLRETKRNKTNLIVPLFVLAYLCHSIASIDQSQFEKCDSSLTRQAKNELKSVGANQHHNLN